MPQASGTALTAVELAKAFFEAKERHDIDATMALFSENAVYTFPFSASGVQNRGSSTTAQTQYAGTNNVSWTGSPRFACLASSSVPVLMMVMMYSSNHARVYRWRGQ